MIGLNRVWLAKKVWLVSIASATFAVALNLGRATTSARQGPSDLLTQNGPLRGSTLLPTPTYLVVTRISLKLQLYTWKVGEVRERREKTAPNASSHAPGHA